MRKDEIPVDEMTGFVTFIYEMKWWLGCVLQVCQDVRKVSIILIPNGPLPSYKYPPREKVILVSIYDILTQKLVMDEFILSQRMKLKQPQSNLSTC